MAVSKRTRFEVMRRDDYTCRYCRSTENSLTIDHVIPVALGGTDDPANLVACCADCNSGKSSSSPDGSLVAQVDEDAARWARARARAIEQVRERDEVRAERHLTFSLAWESWDAARTYIPVDWEQSIDHWGRDGIAVDRVIEALDIALGKRNVPSRDVFRYMAGIVRSWIRELDETTRLEMENGEADGA